MTVGAKATQPGLGNPVRSLEYFCTKPGEATGKKVLHNLERDLREPPRGSPRRVRRARGDRHRQARRGRPHPRLLRPAPGGRRVAQHVHRRGAGADHAEVEDRRAGRARRPGGGPGEGRGRGPALRPGRLHRDDGSEPGGRPAGGARRLRVPARGPPQREHPRPALDRDVDRQRGRVAEQDPQGPADRAADRDRDRPCRRRRGQPQGRAHRRRRRHGDHRPGRRLDPHRVRGAQLRRPAARRAALPARRPRHSWTEEARRVPQVQGGERHGARAAGGRRAGASRVDRRQEGEGRPAEAVPRVLRARPAPGRRHRSVPSWPRTRRPPAASPNAIRT